MQSQQIIECVPNFSNGRDPIVIKQITAEIEKVDGIKLLDVDPGQATNRTVVTFVGDPESVIEAAFQGIKKAMEVIDMTSHDGEHPRMGATDVCPLIPVANITMEETVQYATKLAKRCGEELNLPVYLYEAAATKADRKNLATIRSGEYEGLKDKMKDPNWAPDYGPSEFNSRSGATVIGARDFLVAYNVNLNTTSVRRANAIAFDVREQGRVKTKKGVPLKDKSGNAVRIPGELKSVKGIGWYIEEYGIAQISMNLTNINDTSLHEAFEACRRSATRRGLRVTGSELIGLVPLKVMLDAGKYYLKQQKRSLGVSEDQIIHIAIKSMGLDELSKFEPQKKIIEYQLNSDPRPLVGMTTAAFANETASESPAPGGGSISAYVGALGISLGTMVANLSSQKKGWEKKWELYSEWAEKGQFLKDRLLYLVDEDTHAFNKIMESFRLPKQTEEEKKKRAQAIQDATKNAIQVPFQIMQKAYDCLPLLSEMAENGNPNSVSDAGVGALCIRTAVEGALMNVKINCMDLKDEEYKINILAQAKKLELNCQEQVRSIVNVVNKKIEL